MKNKQAQLDKKAHQLETNINQALGFIGDNKIKVACNESEISIGGTNESSVKLACNYIADTPGLQFDEADFSESAYKMAWFTF